MRSTSLTARSAARSGSGPCASRAAMAACRAEAGARSRGGWVSQWRSVRLPMPVWQLSSSDSRARATTSGASTWVPVAAL